MAKLSADLLDGGAVATPAKSVDTSSLAGIAAASAKPSVLTTDTGNRGSNATPVVTPPVTPAPLSTNQKIANTISAYAAANPAPAGTHYGTTLDASGKPILYKDAAPIVGATGAGSGSGTVAGNQPTANGPAILGKDGFYYQPMSDGTSVKLVQGPSQTSAADTSAIGSISDILTQAGLASLAKDAYAKLNAGVPSSQIINDIRNSPEYAKRFPGMAALASRGDRITEADYISREQSDIEKLKQYGIPSGVFDTTDYLGKLIGNNVTSVDLEKRLMAAQNSVMSLDPSVTQYAKDVYGLDAGHLAAWALDPTMSLPVIQQQAQAMQIGGAAFKAGFTGGLGVNGNLSTTQAENLANANISQAQAQAGFNTLGQEGQFAQALPGDTSGNVTNQQLINAQFGLNAQDTLAVKKVQQARINEFNAGGAVASSASGITGLGAGNATAQVAYYLDLLYSFIQKVRVIVSSFQVVCLRPIET